MKQNYQFRFFVSFVILFNGVILLGQSPSLAFTHDFDKGIERAIQEDKFIFVDVIADWCLPCKKMDKEVYTDPEVISFFSERFVSVRLDGERRGSSFARKYKVTGFPTLLFFSPEGKELHRVEGFADGQRLIQSAEVSFRNPKKRASRFRNDYRKYKDDPNYLRDYIEFCEKTEDFELADKLSDQYIKQIAKIDSVEWMDFVMQYVNKEKSKLFGLLKKNKPAFDALYGKETVDQVFINILMNDEMWKMNSLETEELFKKTTKRINKHNLKIGEEQLYTALANRVFNAEMAFEHNEAKSNLAAKVIMQYSAQVDANYLSVIIANVAVQQNDKSVLSSAKDQINELIVVQPSMFLHDIKSIILYKLGEKEEAFKQVALAQKFAVETKQKYKSSLQIMKKSGLIE